MTKSKQKTKNSKLVRRPIHKRIMLHPIFILIFLCVGVLIVSWTYQVIAESYQVNAIVPAPPLSSGPNINYPTNNQIFNNPNITIQGSCPNNSYIQLTDNNNFDGLAWCNNSTFSIAISLYLGKNILTATAYNITNLASPDTSTVNVNYKEIVSSPPVNSSPPPANPTTSSPSSTTSISKPVTQSLSNPSSTPSNSTPSKSSASTPVQEASPLFLKAKYQFFAIRPNQEYSQTVNILGGTPAYTLLVLWGDNQSSKIITNNSTINLVHYYKKPKFYTIIVNSTDSLGYQAKLQLIADVSNPTIISSNSLNNQNNNFLSPLFGNTETQKNILLVSWPAYVLVLILIFSFWLGEQEYRLNQKIKRSTQLKKQ